MLYDNDVMAETLSIERLEELESKGRIHWPNISEKEIEDRSKGDVFSKAFAVLQTTWFITDCIARRVYGLVITELEVATLAFAALNGILYFLWWDKPLGVACPVPVYLISSKREAGTQTTESDYEENSDPLPPILSDSSHTPKILLSFDNKELNHLVPSVTKEMESTPLERISFALFLHSFKAFVYCCVELFFIVHDFFALPMICMEACTIIHVTGSPALSVPIFYAPSCGTTKDMRDTRSAFIGGITGILFGGTHCIASGFPSVEEKYLWRASAAAITAIPIVLVSISHIVRTLRPNRSDGRRVDSIMQLMIDSPICFGLTLTYDFCTMVYVFSRIVLLILPLIALRSLPSGSLVDINWSSFIPHI